MKVDAPLSAAELTDFGAKARRLEDFGYDGAFTLDGVHDVFLPLVAASGSTQRIELYTGIAIVFARNPMIVADIANDLQLYSRGRFMLGLGSQIRTMCSTPLHSLERRTKSWRRSESGLARWPSG